MKREISPFYFSFFKISLASPFFARRCADELEEEEGASLYSLIVLGAANVANHPWIENNRFLGADNGINRP
jgi:hypothetical protein